MTLGLEVQVASNWLQAIGTGTVHFREFSLARCVYSNLRIELLVN